MAEFLVYSPYVSSATYTFIVFTWKCHGHWLLFSKESEKLNFFPSFFRSILPTSLFHKNSNFHTKLILYLFTKPNVQIEVILIWLYLLCFWFGFFPWFWSKHTITTKNWIQLGKRTNWLKKTSLSLYCQ